MPVREVTLHQIECCTCHAHGPSSVTLAGAMFDAITVGWEICFQMYLCPTCSENGRLPSDTDDLRVTIPATPDNAVVVVTDDDTEGV